MIAIRSYMRKNDTFLCVYSILLNTIHHCKLRQQLLNRQNTSIFNFEANCHKLPVHYVDYYPENNLYGMAGVLKNYMFVNEPRLNLRSYIEHGLFFGNYVNHYSYEYSKINNIITFSEYRENILKSNRHIQEKNPKIIKIGPYIHYSSPFIKREEVEILKQNFGKILLVFPSHSIPGITIEFDFISFISKINEIKYEFKCDTVFICLYWKDIENKQSLEYYINMGYIIVSAGHSNDPFFMSRLKSIIELSDITMSNDVGTNLGYCIYMKKPHFVYVQEQGFKEGLRSVLKRENISKDIYDSSLQAKKEIETLFSVPSESISQEQDNLIDYYWGTSHVKQADELYKLIF